MSERKRLSKALAAAGVASRRHCEILIFEGRVTVNGEVCLLPQHHVCWDTDIITLDGEVMNGEQKKVYFILNKPRGHLCSNATTSSCSKRVVDLFSDIPQRVFTVGRLDKDTTGLLIVTNDGHFSNQVIHPRSGLEKEYVAKTHRAITPQQLNIIRGGTEVEETFVKPVHVVQMEVDIVKVIVMEGKRREVRKLIEHAGLKTIDLERTRIGSLRLPDLKVGHWRPMTTREKEIIFE